MTAREFDYWQRVAWATLMLKTREVPDHLIQKVAVTVTLEFRDGVEMEFVEEAWA